MSNKEILNCGCGGEAGIDYLGRFNTHDLYYVYCKNCYIQTANYGTETKAVKAWNKAMSAKDINVPNKFATDTNVGDKTAKFKQDGEFLRCERCNHIVDSGYKYCPECGYKLEW